MTIETMRELLARDYGIHSDADLDNAIKAMKKVNIFAMVSSPQVRKKGRKRNVRLSRETA